MIITNLLEYVGKNVQVYFEDGNTIEGKLEYVPAYSEMYDFRRPKHFYICNKDGDWCFRAWHVKSVIEVSDYKNCFESAVLITEDVEPTITVTVVHKEENEE